MAFNFGGMMRGLGAGMVGYGEILKENEKRNWESEQARLKELRAENLAKLQMQNQKDLTGMQIQATKEEGAATRAQQSEQFDKNYGLNKEELELRRQDTASSNAARGQQLSIAQQELDMKKQAYTDASPAAQKKERLATAEALKELGLPKEAIGMFVATGQMPQFEKTGIKVDGSDLVAIQEQATEEWNKMDKSEQRKAARALGVKNTTEAFKIFKANAVADFFSFTGKTVPQTQGTPAPQAGTTINFKSLRDQALAGDSNAIAQIKSLASSTKYKDNQAIQSTLREIENKYRQSSSDTDPSFFNVGNYSE